MKKFLGVLAAALVIALALWVALRVQQANRAMKATELLPQSTLLLAEIPDFRSTREHWHASDLYALWREPAVQEWLREPLARLEQKRRGDQTLPEFLKLGPTEAFAALVSLENNQPKFIGGFHYDRSDADARRFIEAREAPLLAKAGSAKRETIQYQQHQIETVNAGHFALATVYDRNWFLASNDLKSLQALLDRLDRRTPDATRGSLRDSEAFTTATKNLPTDYDGMFFLDPTPFLEKLLPLLAMAGQSPVAGQWQRLKQVRSVAGSLGFTGGKMHEVLFIGMPRVDAAGKITRPSLSNAGKETFFYSDALTRWPEQWQMASASPAPALPAFLQLISEALLQAGLTQGDLSAAFGSEMEIIGSWPADSHWPVVSVTLPVRDSVRARKIADAIATVPLAGSAWTRTEKEGVSSYVTEGFGGFVPIRPAFAISDRQLIAGTDAAAVESAITQKAAGVGELEKSAAFREAVARVPAGDSGFNYLDPGLLFSRADAALRPLLLMSATLYPALGQKVDVAKLPPADVITKHLSPIVMSQRYTGDGYLSESIGPVSFNEAALGLGGAVAGGYLYFVRGFADLYRVSPTPAPAQIPGPSASPTPSPISP